MRVLDLLVPMLSSLPPSLYSCHGLPGQSLCLRKLLESEQDPCPSRAAHTHFRCTHRTSSGHTVRCLPLPLMERVKSQLTFFPGSPWFNSPSPAPALPVRLQRHNSSPAQNTVLADPFSPSQQKLSLLPLFRAVSGQTHVCFSSKQL